MDKRDHNAEQLLRLWVRNQGDVYRHIFSLLPNVSDAQEVLQSTSIALWRKAGEFDFERPFLPLAFRFALMEVRKHRERNRRSTTLIDDALLETLAVARAEAHDAMELRRQALDGCVAKLGPSDRDLIDRHYHRQMTVPEIAGGTGRNIHTLYKALQRVRRQLLECITAKLAAD